MCVPCINCGGTSIALVHATEGCVVHPDAEFLPVCPQHLNNDGFCGDVTLVSEIEPGLARWAGW